MGIREKINFEKIKNNKKIKIALGAVVVLLMIAIGVACYFWGVGDGKQSVTSAKNQEATSQKDTKKNPSTKEEEISKAAVDATGEAVSAAAVSMEAVSPESASADGQSEGKSDKQGANPGQNNSSKDVQSEQRQSGQTSQVSVAGGGSAKASDSYAGKLKVIGTQLCTSDGTPIQLRGVSTHGLSWFPEYVNSQMFAEIRSWGANTVRLAMYTAEYNGYCTGDSANRAALKQLIKKGVQYATEQNLYVIIDWHILSDSNPNSHKSEAIAFFSEMADQYKDNDHVLYEICNEPNGGTSWGEVKSYANDVIAAIRQRDPDGVILVGTPTWCQDVEKAAADPISGYDNIMYTLHFYADTHRDSLRNAMVSAIQKGLPIFVSEFGICDASGNGAINISQGDTWIQTLNSYGVSYVAWNLSNKAESSALIQSGCSKKNGITQDDLSESGKWLLRTLSGTVAASTDSQASPQDNNSQGSEQQQNQAVQDTTTQQQDYGQSNQGYQPPEAKSPEQFTPQAQGGAQATPVNSWQEGNVFSIQYEIKVSNTSGGQQEGWTGTLVFPANVKEVSGWNGNFSFSGNTVTFTSMDYNKTIPAGGTVEGIGCIVKFE